MKASILKAVAVTAELTGAELSETALRVMAADLDSYSETAVLRALDRCRRELKARLTLGAVLERIEEQDGRREVKVVTYGSWRWLDLPHLWDTGFEQKGGLILIQKDPSPAEKTPDAR